MPDWNSVQVLLLSARALSLIIHTLFGVYMWEFITTLDFDWKFLTGRETWRWTYVVYFLARYTALVLLICLVRIQNVYNDINCTVWIGVIEPMANVAIACSSLILLLRVLAVSGWNKYLTAVLGTLYLANTSLMVAGVIINHRVPAYWIPDLYTCAEGGNNTEGRLVSTYTYMVFGFDATSCITLVFLLWRCGTGQSLWRLVIAQGVVWFVLSTLTYLTAAIIVTVNLNVAISWTAAVTTATIMPLCATRMYRSLFYAARTSPTTLRPSIPSMKFSESALLSSGRGPTDSIPVWRQTETQRSEAEIQKATFARGRAAVIHITRATTESFDRRTPHELQTSPDASVVDEEMTFASRGEMV